MKRKNAEGEPAGKRRRSAPDDEVDPAAAQAASVKAYIFHASKLLLKAAKKARTFEVQKLVRKLKATREPKEGEPDAALLVSLEALLAALKALPLTTVPAHILHARLPKLACIHDILPTLLASFPSSPLVPTGAELLARNRVLASKSLHEAWEEVSRAVMKRMGEEVPDRPAPTTKVTTQTKAPVASTVLATPLGSEKRLSKRAARAAAGAAKATLPKPGMDPGRKALLEELPVARRDDRDSGDEADDPEDSYEASDDDEEVMRVLARLGAGSDSAFSDEYDSSSDAPPPLPSPKKQRSTIKPVTSSAFLPSLAGGYISYSDSDGEDAKWVKDAEKDDKKERKNRRGQRARRVIWEQKYGSGAKHVAAALGGTAAPTKGKKATTKLALRKAASIPVEIPPAFSPANQQGADRNPNAQPVAERRAVVSRKDNAGSKAEKVHPSWEAKRKQHEAMLASMKSAGAGKKITFD